MEARNKSLLQSVEENAAAKATMEARIKSLLEKKAAMKTFCIRLAEQWESFLELNRKASIAWMKDHRSFYEDALGKRGCEHLLKVTSEPLPILDLRYECTGKIIDSTGAKVMASVLGSLTRLRELCLNGNNIGAGGVNSLVPALQRLTQLESLHLYRNNISAEGIAKLAHALGFLAQLTTLSLGGNHIGRDGIVALVPALEKLVHLKALNLNDNAIGAAGAVALAPVLGKLTKMTKLYLNRNDIGARGAKDLGSALQKLVELQIVDLYHNDIGEAGAEALLTSGLRNLKKLTRLFLGRNNIGVTGAKYLAIALENLPQLESLYLQGNHIGCDGIVALVPALQKLGHLKTLNLEDNAIGAAGAEALAPVLGKLIKMTKLYLGHNNIRSKGIEVLAPALPLLEQLAELYLDRNSIGENVADILVSALQGLQLEQISFKHNDLGEKFALALMQHLPKLKDCHLPEPKDRAHDVRTHKPSKTQPFFSTPESRSIFLEQYGSDMSPRTPSLMTTQPFSVPESSITSHDLFASDQIQHGGPVQHHDPDHELELETLERSHPIESISGSKSDSGSSDLGLVHLYNDSEDYCDYCQYS